MVRDRFEPVHQQSTAALIAGQLRTAIMYGELAPGSQLSEADLSAEFGVSRGPLREAMQRLVQEGLLRSEPNRGLFVMVLDDDDIRDIYAARSAIEAAAISAIITAKDPEAASALHAACDEMTEAARLDDLIKMTDADLRFHEVLVAQSQSARLVRMHKTLLVETRMCLTALEETYRPPADTVAEHALIIEAIEADDIALALQRTREHMDDALIRLTSLQPR